MRVLVVHNLYQQAGGEDQVARAETALLAGTGRCAVELLEASNDEIRTPLDKLGVALRAGYAPKSRRRIEKVIERFQPDLVHVHNFFPLLTPSIHVACQDRGIPVVQTLHNYRLICANAVLLREGRICEDCLGGSRLPALRHRCYRGSLPGTLSVMAMQHSAWRRMVASGAVTRFIALTAFAREIFVAAGVPKARIVVKPNFIAAPEASEDLSGARAGALFVGRLSPEKGARQLIEAWRRLPGAALDVIGDGPDGPALRAMAPGNVRLLGALPHVEVRRRMARARFLIVPSLWHEGFPMTILEAFSAGLPVLCPRLGALGEIVTDGENGLHYPPGGEAALALGARALVDDDALVARLSAGARRTYIENYTPQANAGMLEAIYAEAIAEDTARKDSR